MKNIERQNKLDEEKWLVSEAKKCDQSGKIYWCFLCDYKCGVGCKASQAERDSKCLCATAYNRYKRNKGAKK